MSKWHVVAVHGVGDANPGQVIHALTMHVPGREATDRPAYQMGELLIQGESYPSAKGPGPDDPTLYEVNWADIRRPQESRFGVARHILDVILSLLDIASRWHFGAREGDRTKLLGAYGFLVECALRGR